MPIFEPIIDCCLLTILSTSVMTHFWERYVMFSTKIRIFAYCTHSLNVFICKIVCCFLFEYILSISIQSNSLKLLLFWSSLRWAACCVFSSKPSTVNTHQLFTIYIYIDTVNNQGYVFSHIRTLYGCFWGTKSTRELCCVCALARWEVLCPRLTAAS